MGKQIKEKPTKQQPKTKKLAKVKQQHAEPLPKLQELNLPKQEHHEDPQQSVPKKEESKSKGKRNRLIIRNLVFDIGEKHLRKLLAPYGEIVDLEVPANPNNSKSNRGFAFVQFKSYRSCEKAIKELNQSQYKGRTIVLDFSVNKQRFMTSQLEDKQQSEGVKEQNSELKKEEHNQQQIKQEKEEKEEVEEDRDEVIRRQREAEDLSATIFIRNLPISVSQDQLRDFLARYGKIRWARVVIDRQTNTPKGTAFVKFVDPKVAKQLIDYSWAYEMFLLNKNPHFRSDPRFSLELDGTILKIFPSEKRQAIAEKVKERQVKEEERKVKVKPLKKIKKLKDLIQFDKDGKRKIALAAIGLWQPSDEMSEDDRERFAAHAREKIQKLKNPNNSVSDKRIILKYLDKNVTEEQLKDLAHEFLQAHKLKPKELTYCKLMLDSERKKSAGFAFIEFAHSQHSQTFIEELSQNYSYLCKRPYVIQFAIQDSRKMQKILNRSKQ